MKTTKKMLVALLGILMCMGLFAGVASAAQKRVKSQINYRLDGSEWIKEDETKYTYNKDGSIKTETTQLADGTVFKTVFSNKGDKVQSYTNGKLEYTRTYTRKNSIMAKSVIKYADGKEYTTTYTYDKKGHIKKHVGKGSDGSQEEVNYTVNSKGYIIKEVRDDNGSKGVTTYTYNKNGLQTSSKYVTSDYTWDVKRTYYTSGKAKNLLKTMSEKNNKGVSNTYKYTYKFDKAGNQTEKVSTSSFGRTIKTVYKY